MNAGGKARHEKRTLSRAARDRSTAAQMQVVKCRGHAAESLSNWGTVSCCAIEAINPRKVQLVCGFLLGNFGILVRIFVAKRMTIIVNGTQKTSNFFGKFSKVIQLC
jgi:hypothetical protein